MKPPRWVGGAVNRPHNPPTGLESMMITFVVRMPIFHPRTRRVGAHFALSKAPNWNHLGGNIICDLIFFAFGVLRNRMGVVNKIPYILF